MQKLFEGFNIFHFQKRIVSAETIRVNMYTISNLNFTGYIRQKNPIHQTGEFQNSSADR